MKEQIISLILTISFLPMTNVLCGQKPAKLYADSIIVYKGFNSGGTTANLHYYSSNIDTMLNVTKVLLSKDYLDSLNLKMTGIKARKHFQQKIGPCYYATVFREKKVYQIVFVINFGIIDLTLSKQYRNDLKFESFISRLINNNYH